jgi:hypothetical protein
MVNDLLTAVTTQLGKTFGTTYHYYVENVKQGLKHPCFTVDVIQPTKRVRSPFLYDRKVPLVIHFFNPAPDTLKRDSYTVAEQTVECLEHLPFQNGFIRGEKISWQIVEDVLQIFVTYDFMTQKVVPMDNMEQIKVEDPELK